MSEFERLSGELEEGTEQIVGQVLDRSRPALPEWMSQNVFLWGEIRDFARASLRCELDGFRRGVLPDRCPEIDAAGARAGARIGELKRLTGGYREGQRCLWEAWLHLVETTVTESGERQALLTRGSEYFFDYARLVGDFVTDVYQAELERSIRSLEQRRFEAIRGVLEGGSLVDAELGIDLEQHHLGFVVWGAGGEERAREVAAAVGRPIVSIAMLNQSWWGWLSSGRPLSAEQEQTLRRYGPPAGTGLAFGLEGFGESGFCATHRQALKARWVARKTERPVVFYADVAVEALASDNQADARAFVAHELAGIDDDSPASEQIRETLAAYFAAEHNAASAGAALGIHQQTVANRLRRAEERLGHPVGTRRVELEVALRLRASLTRADS